MLGRSKKTSDSRVITEPVELTKGNPTVSPYTFTIKRKESRQTATWTIYEFGRKIYTQCAGTEAAAIRSALTFIRDREARILKTTYDSKGNPIG